MISDYYTTGGYTDMRRNRYVRVTFVDSLASGTGTTTCEFEHSDTSVCYEADPYTMPESLFIEPECKTYDRPPQKIKARSANTKNFLRILKQPTARMGFKRGQKNEQQL